MSADELADFYVHTVTVATFLGTNGLGADTFSPATDVLGFMELSRRLVRNAGGEQVISESTLYTDPANASAFLPNSKVTYGGSVSRVILAKAADSGSLDLLDHLIVALT